MTWGAKRRRRAARRRWPSQPCQAQIEHLHASIGRQQQVAWFGVAMHQLVLMGMRQALLQALEADILIEASGGPERAEFNRIRREQGLKAALHRSGITLAVSASSKPPAVITCRTLA